MGLVACSHVHILRLQRGCLLCTDWLRGAVCLQPRCLSRMGRGQRAEAPECLRLCWQRARHLVGAPTRRVGVDPPQDEFVKEMKATVNTFRDRASNVDEDEDEDNIATTASSSDQRKHRQVRSFSSEFHVEPGLLKGADSRQHAAVEDLNKARLLAYYARRDAAMTGRGPHRPRAASQTDMSHTASSAIEAVEAVGPPARTATRSGTLRAARTSRMYSDPTAPIGGMASSMELAANSAVRFSMPDATSTSPSRRALPPLPYAPRPGTIAEGDELAGSSMASSDAPPALQAGVPHFRSASSSSSSVTGSAPH